LLQKGTCDVGFELQNFKKRTLQHASFMLVVFLFSVWEQVLSAKLSKTKSSIDANGSRPDASPHPEK